MNKILLNPTQFYHPDTQKMTDTVDVIDYPIAEAAKGLDGEPIWDANMGTYRSTGRTLEVSILRGQAVELEGYLADVLLDRYEFLKESKKAKHVISGTEQAEAKVEEKAFVSNEVEAKPVEEKPVDVAGEYHSKGCGKSFTQADELGLHIGMKHPELLPVK